MATRRAGRRSFGEVDRLPSGRYRARYTAYGRRHSAVSTFEAKIDAEGWLHDERRMLNEGTWTPPETRNNIRIQQLDTFGPYAEAWILERPLSARTREHYGKLIAGRLAPLADIPLKHISPAVVRSWRAKLPQTPTMNKHAYALLKGIMRTAVEDGIVATNPCHIRGAGNGKTVHQTEIATVEQLNVIADAIPERYRAMVLVAAWCGLRYGELTELRRSDVDLKNGVIHVRRGVVKVGNEFVVGPPKSEAGKRKVEIPPHKPL